MAGFQRADRHCSYRFVPDDRERQELEALIRQYETAREDTRLGSDTVRELIVMGLLVLVNRMVARQDFAETEQETLCDPKIRASGEEMEATPFRGVSLP